MRRYLGYLQGLLLTLGLFYLAFRGTDITAVWQQMTRASWGGLILAAFLNLMSFPLRALRWQSLLRPAAAHLPYRLLLEATFLGYTVSAAAPGRLGELVRPGIVSSRKKVPLGPALGSIVTERLIDVMMMTAVLAIGLAIVPITGEASAHAPLIRRAGLGAALGGIVASLVLVALISKQSLLEKTARRAGRLSGWLLRSLLAVSDGARVFHSPKLLARVAVESTATWGMTLIGFWVGLRAVGVEVPFAASFLLLPLVVLGVALPTPAGAGGYHAALVFGLTRFFGVDVSLAASAALLNHLIGNAFLLGIGATLLLGGRFTLGDLMAIGREVRRLGSLPTSPPDGSKASTDAERQG